jgi:hypothetical protein
MGVVTGAQVTQADADHQEDVVVEQEGGEPSSPSRITSSGAARLAAMRRRRFKKTAAAEGEKTPAKDEGAQEQEAITNEDTEPESATVEAESTPVAADDSEPKKKYKGVARMRRQMIKEKQQKEAAKTAVSPTTETPAKIPVPIKTTSRIPIVLHLLTIVFLFVAGLDVGFHAEVSPNVMVHMELAPYQYGIGVLNRNAADGPVADTTSDPKERLMMEASKEWSAMSETAEHEFDKPTEQEAEEYVPNIDPLFRVDLDKMAEGDTFFKMLARFAVSCHRVNLYIFYYLPLSVLSALFSLPRKLIITPPILCLVSLATRLFAKRVLGAGIPTPPEETAKEDVLAMLKQGVMNFFKSSFPMVAGFYDGFTNLRADMYVILCGVFVGLAWSHLREGVSEEPVYGTDEL